MLPIMRQPSAIAQQQSIQPRLRLSRSPDLNTGFERRAGGGLRTGTQTSTARKPRGFSLGPSHNFTDGAVTRLVKM
jgi:hypothetical protein